MGQMEESEKSKTNRFLAPVVETPSRGGGLAFLSQAFKPFSYRDFRLMWLGAFTSTTGAWMQQVAEAWMVLDLTGSAFYLGLTAFLGQLPIILFSLVGGVVADRIDRRKLLLGSQYIQMVTALVLTGLIILDWIQIWHFLIAVFVVGSAQSFGGPAYQALLPGLVDRKYLPNAIALNSLQFNLARFIGPILAGLTLSLGGPAFCFAINGISFLAVITSLYIIRSSFSPPKTKESVMEGMKRGFAFLKERGALWQLSVLGFIGTFCGISLVMLLPVFAKEVFQIGLTGYSTMMAISGAGAVVGAILYAGLAGTKSGGKMTLKVQLTLSVLITVFAFSTNLSFSYFVLFLSGAVMIGLFASINSLVQLNTTEEMRGRVMSIFFLAFRGGMPLGGLVAGFLASQISASFALVVMGAILCFSALAFLFSSSQLKEV